VVLLSSGCRIIRTRLASTPKSLRRPLRANTALPKPPRLFHPSRLYNAPHAISHPPKSTFRKQPSASHPSFCLKAEWLDKGFRVTGQRVFCAYSRRPSCTSCIPRVDPSRLYHDSFLHFLFFLGIGSFISSNTTGRNNPPCLSYHTWHPFACPRWYRVLYVASLFRCFFLLPGFLQ